VTWLRYALILLLAAVCSTAMAAERLAVLELTGDLPQKERALLADTIRGGVVSALGDAVQVMTRENMEVMLTDMGIDASCVAEGACEVETARNLGVDYVVSGNVVSLSGVFVVSLKLYATQSGQLLASLRDKGEDTLALMDSLEGKCVDLVAKVKPGAGVPAPVPAPVPIPAPAEPAPPEPAPLQPKPAPAPEKSLKGPMVVTVLDAGAEPRAVLTYHPTVGARQHVTLTDTTAPPSLGKKKKAKGHTTTFETQLDSVIDRVEDGVTHFSTRVADWAMETDAPPGTPVGMKPRYVGKTFQGSMGSAGETESLSSSVIHPSVPQLPTEAIGAGARWQLKQDEVLGGRPTTTQATYTVTSIDGERVVLGFEMTVTSPLEKLEGSDTQMGTTNSYTGEISLDLGSLYPLKMSMRGATTTETQQPGQPPTSSSRAHTYAVATR